GLVHPVDAGILEQLAVTQRHMDPDIGVLRASFQQQNGILARSGETIGENTPGRSGADDDVVEFFGLGRSWSPGRRLIVHIFPNNVSAGTRNRKRPERKRTEARSE